MIVSFPNLESTDQRVAICSFWLQQVVSCWQRCSFAPIQRHWELALALLSEMVHQKLPWDNISLTCAVRACASCSEWQLAMQLFLWMKLESLKTSPFIEVYLIYQWRLV